MKEKKIKPLRRDDKVTIEIRAAEIAIMPDDEDGMTSNEFVGWCAGAEDGSCLHPTYQAFILDGDNVIEDEQLAGFLARIIADHGNV